VCSISVDAVDNLLVDEATRNGCQDEHRGNSSKVCNETKQIGKPINKTSVNCTMEEHTLLQELNVLNFSRSS